MNQAELVKQAESVFVLPDSVTRIQACIEDPTTTLDDIAELISFDPSLTSQILKIANSAFYRFAQPVSTVSKAVQIMGTKATYDLVVSYGVSHALKDIPQSVIDLDRFWEQSVSCALLCKYIGELMRCRETEKLFVIGLLHNIGELVMASIQPDVAKQNAQHNPNMPSANKQQQLMGFHYAEFSAAILEAWELPDTIYQPIKQIHSAPSEKDVAATITKIGYQLAVSNVYADHATSDIQYDETLGDKLMLSDRDIQDAVEQTNLQLLSVIQLFNPNAFQVY